MSVFQVLTDDGGVAGAGFLTSEDTGLTCAHVVHAAGYAPGGRVEVVFPGLPDAPRVSAEVAVERWLAPEADDVAVLRFATVPAGARGMAVGVSAGSRGHHVSSFGFPAQVPQAGHFGYAEAGDLLPGNGGAQLLQLAKANDLTTGFSGGPVVDEATGLVIGMVTSIASPDTHLKGLSIAYATPAEVLRAALPLLPEHHACPYLGLEPFADQHANWFFGRTAAVERVLAPLRENRRLMMLLGPSGAGKSSLVNAGVLPALSEGAVPGSDRWLPVCARPGQDLLTALEDAGLPGTNTDGLSAAVKHRLAADLDHERVLLVIDQFEELLTQQAPDADQSADARRLRAVEQLVQVADSHAAVTVLMVMRNDFYASLDALAPDLMNAAMPGLCNVPATLSRPELKEIITRPAAAVGVPLEPGLANRIVNDILGSGPAARQAPVTLLPALELALRQLWMRRRREDGRLTHAAYEKIGKVTGSLTDWCNRALGRLPAEQHLTARQILTALVRPADADNGVPATRRLVPLTRLRALTAAPNLNGHTSTFDAVIAALTRCRIITTGATAAPDRPSEEPAAELIHDALIRDWADLRDWVAQDHQFQVWLLRAAEQQDLYARSGLPSDLLHGTLLSEGEEWAGLRPLPAEITSLLDASRQREQAALRRTRRISAILATMLALALVATGLALWQQQEATVAQKTAESAQLEAQSRQLAAQSSALVDSDPDLAALLAVKAYLTSPTDEAAVSLWHCAGLGLKQRLAGHDGSINAVAFSADGKTVATASVGKVVRLWDATHGRQTGMFTSHHSGDISAMAFSPGGKTLATGDHNGTVRLWEAATRKQQKILKSGDGMVGDLAFSSDGKTLATAGGSRLATGEGNGTVRLWDVATGKQRSTFNDLASPAYAGPVYSLAFSPDGKTLATGLRDGTVRRWNLANGKQLDTLGDVPGNDVAISDLVPVFSVAFSPDGKTLVTGQRDGTVRRWNLANGKGGNIHGSDDNEVHATAFNPDGTILATGAIDGTVRLWSLATGQERGTFNSHSGPVQAMAFSPDGKTLAAGDGNGTARLWDWIAATDNQQDVLRGDHSVTSVAFSRDGRTLATANIGVSRPPRLGTMRVWDAATSKQRFDLNQVNVDAMAFPPGGRTLVTAISEGSGEGSGAVRLLDLATGRQRYIRSNEYAGQDDAVDVSPDGKTLAIVTGDGGTLQLRNLVTGKKRTLFRGDDSPGYREPLVVFSPDGRTVAAGESSGTVRLWDVATGKKHGTLNGQGSSVYDVRFSPDGQTVATGEDSGTVRLWDVATGKKHGTLNGQGSSVYDVRFSPDGQTVATGEDSGTVRLWDVATRRERGTLNGHGGAVSAMAFSPDGKTLATGEDSGTVRLWKMALPDPDGAMEQICRALHRDFTREERSQYLQGLTTNPVCTRHLS
ncbi:trypsin-like peptidase domain-containing protein [Streptomyces sp. NPDC059262]|uniref:nSTAND1 domain-containing NTPase n=1 Tax=Streptomyces sp. NPDC059262 TaxID=3346797 RepID=UPI0036CF5B79